jgi:hypothetical protein
MFINKYVTYDDDEVILNPYFLSTLTPANAVNPYLSSSAANVFLSPHSPYLLSVEKTICKDDKKKDDNKIKISLPILSPIYQSYVPRNYSYQNVNNNRELIMSVTRYFYEGTMERWLYSDFQDLLKYLVIKKNKVHIVKNREELRENELDKNMDDMRLKIRFISEYVMTKYDMKNFIKKLALKSGIDLWKFKNHKSKVKKAIFYKIKRKLEKLSFESEY